MCHLSSSLPFFVEFFLFNSSRRKVSVRPFFLRFAEFSRHAKRWSRSAESESPNKKVVQSPSGSCGLKMNVFWIESFYSWYFHHFDRERIPQNFIQQPFQLPGEGSFPLFDVVANVVLGRDLWEGHPMWYVFLEFLYRRNSTSTQRKSRLHPSTHVMTAELPMGLKLFSSNRVSSSCQACSAKVLFQASKKCQWRRLRNV